jgi:hypothetical protein
MMRTLGVDAPVFTCDEGPEDGEAAREASSCVVRYVSQGED